MVTFIQRNRGWRAEQIKDFVVFSILTGMLSKTQVYIVQHQINIVYLENEYYATVWNTTGLLGETLNSTGSVDISLDVANTVTKIETTS